jgi:hypothetical protein
LFFFHSFFLLYFSAMFNERSSLERHHLGAILQHLVRPSTEGMLP